ncbi:hypothetical protein ACSBR1_040096 [Camellia fascicularis]
MGEEDPYAVAEMQRLLLDQHKEHHFTSSEIVRDVIIGVSDSLTVPFALVTGLSGANVPSSIILTAGIAEVAAGAISMGLGRYLAAKSKADHYMRELKREQEEIIKYPDTEAAEVAEILSQYGIEPPEYGPVQINILNVVSLHLYDCECRFELGLEKPDPMRALQSALTISIA